MVEGFYRRGLLRYKQVATGLKEIIEPEAVFPKVYSKLGVITDPEIYKLYTVFMLTCKERDEQIEMMMSYECDDAPNVALEGVKKRISTLDGELHAHAYYLQLRLRAFFGIAYESEEYIYLYAGWIASLCEPYEWVYNTPHSPKLAWGNA